MPASSEEGLGTNLEPNPKAGPSTKEGRGTVGLTRPSGGFLTRETQRESPYGGRWSRTIDRLFAKRLLYH